MSQKPLVSFGDSSAEVNGLRLARYSNNDALAVLAELVWDGSDVEPRVPVSINLSHGDNDWASDELPRDEFYAKSYSEGERLFNALIACGWIEVVGPDARSGFVSCKHCRLTDKAVILADDAGLGLKNATDVLG